MIEEIGSGVIHVIQDDPKLHLYAPLGLFQVRLELLQNIGFGALGSFNELDEAINGRDGTFQELGSKCPLAVSG